MKKSLSHTRVSVKLRKAEFRKEWYLYIESCNYADKVRAMRQREYDNAALYTDSEAEHAAQNERSQCNFISYFNEVADKRHRNSSESINVN